MSEDYGIVRYKKLTAPAADKAIKAIKDCIINCADDGGHWLIDDDIALTKPDDQLVLKPRTQNFTDISSNIPGNPNNQRIAIRVRSGYLDFAYIPDGLASIANFDGINSTNVTHWTGFRSIYFNFTPDVKTLWVVQHRDQSSYNRYPASTLTVLIGDKNSGIFRLGVQAGRAISTINSNDFERKIFGDAMLIGSLNEGSTWPKWIKNSDSTTPYKGLKPIQQCAVYSINPELTWKASYIHAIYQNVGSLHVMSNYLVDPAILGNLKYIKHSSINNPANALIYSSTPGSKQSWKYCYDDIESKQYLLWGPEKEVL